MSVLIRRYLNRSRAAQELVEDWKIGHEPAMLSIDLEELVNECVDLGKLARRTWDGGVEWLFDEKIEIIDIDRVAAMMRTALEKSLDVCAVVRELARQVQDGGHSISGLPQLEQTRADLETLTEELDKTLPAEDKEMVREALAAYARGEYQSAEELLNESLRGGSEAD